MKLPDELLQQVTLGTFLKRDLSLLEVSDDDWFQVLDRADRPLEGRLLLKVVSIALQQQAGFLSKKLVSPPDTPARRNQTSALGVEAVDHFIKLLSGGIDVALLPEWCRLVVKTQQHLPDEFAPTVMRFGNRLDAHRTYLRGVLSEKAVWLAKYSQRAEWQWVLTTPIPAGKYLTGIRYEREEQLIKLIRDTHPYDMRKVVLPHFAIYFQTWSSSLTQIFLEYVVQDDPIDTSYEFLDALENFAYFAPIEFHAQVAPSLLMLSKNSNLKQRFEAMYQIIQIRADIHKHIYANQ